ADSTIDYCAPAFRQGLERAEVAFQFLSAVVSIARIYNV
ncbi:MAG: hypothetical protein ACI9G5_002392, partial [Paracoccaceae bacterium]